MQIYLLLRLSEPNTVADVVEHRIVDWLPNIFYYKQ